MALLDTMGMIANGLQFTSSSLSLMSDFKNILLTAPGISASLTNPTIGGLLTNMVGFPTGVTPYGKSPNLSVITNDQIDMKAQITDHYTEENFAIQDHIAFEPVKFTIVGEVGELTYSPSPLEKYVQAVFDRLGALDIIQPKMCVKAYQYLSAYSRLQSAISSTMKVVNDLAGMAGIDGWGLNKQQEAFKFFTGLYSQRTLLRVDTPWKSFDNMLIESLSFVQEEETKHKTKITIGFKQLRTISTLTNTGPLTGKIASQAKDLAKKGPAPGQAKDISAAKQIFNAIGAK